jgi:transcriptional regulator with XRE-family HTH domain
MHYTQLFRNLREAKGLTLEALARLARRHRNTVINVESGRPVKFKTVAELMAKMGYSANSSEMKSMALLWLESVSGIPFSRPEVETSARKAVAAYRSTARQAARNLDGAIARAGLDASQIELLIFAVRHPETIAIIDGVRTLAAELSAEQDRSPQLKVAEEE